MAKKNKVGKARKDKFYQLAKETGYRSRASFKLLQLNRKFEFLQKSRVVIDLCAAPGGWLQVVAENTPISSIIVGVDLVSIKPIKNVKTYQEDITTEKCRQTIRKELHTWKADCVLNDGAPNLGKSWIHDAFQQVSLTLHAVKLATEFLRKGGWFISKVFRSKDYNSLLWVLQQLFQHVHATKPQASRTESAEIFVVCQGFLAPSKIDPKFFDSKYVFKDIEEEKKLSLDLIHPEKKKRNREGYTEGDTFFMRLPVSEFFNAENHLETLAAASEVILDDKKIASHPSTTAEIKECLKDIKVLGKKEIKNIITWRKKLKKEFEDVAKPEEEVVEKEEENEDEVVQTMIAACKDEERRKIKKKLKKIREQKTKLRQKMDSKMVLSSDKMNLATDDNYFKLDKVTSEDQLEDVDLDAEELDSDQEEGDQDTRNRSILYDKEDKSYLDSDSDELEFEEEPEFDSDDEDAKIDEEPERQSNPLVVDIEHESIVTSNKTKSWFSKESFAGIGDDDEEDEELEKMVADYKKKGGSILENGTKAEKRKLSQDDNQQKKKKKKNVSDEKSDDDSGVEDSDDDDTDDSSDGDDSDSDSNYGDMDANQLVSNGQPGKAATSPKKKKKSKKEDFEIVPAEDLKLDAVGLAIGAKMVSSRKKKRDIIDESYHRYMFDDENLPDWFVEEEAKYTERQLPVTKAEIEEYKLKQKAIDAQPIKKVAEAKARKKRKAAKKLEKVRRKAEVITENVDVSEKEKWQQIKQLYKKAGLLKKDKKEVTYVVGKRGVGQRVSRPAGVKGPYKVVDPRMKADNRKQKANLKKAQKNKFRKKK